MTRIESTKSAPQSAAVASPSVDPKQRETEIFALASAVEGGVASYPNSSMMVTGSFQAAFDEHGMGAPWPKLIDAIIATYRKCAAVPAYGKALCDAAERLTVTFAKAQSLVDSSYQPPKA